MCSLHNRKMLGGNFMDFMKKYDEWLNSPSVDEKDKEDLKKLVDNEKELEDCFYKDLTFGTGGIRGIRGLGTNRINKYVIRRATQGLANYMLRVNDDSARGKGIIIAHDCRIGSKEYAMNTARVMAANGIKAYVYSDLRSTPDQNSVIAKICLNKAFCSWLGLADCSAITCVISPSMRILPIIKASIA